MKKGLLYSLIGLLVLGAGGGYYWFQWRDNTPGRPLKELVPAHAVMVYGSQNLHTEWQQLKEHPMGELLEGMPFFTELEKQYAYLDTLGTGISFSKAWLEQPVYISMHLTGRSGFDFIYYVELPGRAQQGSLAGLHEHFKADPTLRYKEREFEGRTIHQFEQREGSQSFYYFTEGNYFVGSFTGYLLEDVIRHLTDDGKDHFFAQHPSMPISAKAYEGQWWVNLRKWPELMKVFLPANEEARWPAFADYLHLDWVLGEKVVLGSGFAPMGIGNEPKDFLDVLQSQQNGRFRIVNQLPSRMAWAFHWRLQNSTGYQDAMYQYQLKNAAETNRQREAFANRFLLDYQDFFDKLGEEAAMVVLESVNIENPDRLILLESTDPNRTLQWLRNLSSKVAETSLDSLYMEEYLGQEIRLADVYNLPAFLFGSNFEGFPQTFYTSHGNYILLGNTAQGIRRLLDDWNQGEILGKSVRSAVFLENTLQEGVCGWILQSPRAWNHALATLNTEWAGYFEQDGLAWRGLAQGAIQFRKDDQQWFVSMALQPEVDQITPGERRFQTRLNHQFPHELTTGPSVVRNHNTGARETLLQDASNTLYLVDLDGKVLWQDSISEAMVGDVTQIDYFNNGKLQYFFTTQTQLHVIDRKGDEVEGYPVSLPNGQQVAFSTVIDYDGSKHYRLAVATTQGQVYLYDKDGTALEGWSPRKFAAPLVHPPVHVRVRGIDRLVFTLANHNVVVTNRRGEVQTGFPVDVRGRMASPLFIQEGTDLDNSFFTAVTTDGELVQFNMEGKVTERKQLYKPSREATFALVPDVLGQTFLISRMSEGQIGFLSATGNEVFSKDFLTSGNVVSQFYRFGAGKELIIVTDLEQDFSYVFDYQGNLVNYRPLNNAQQASVLYYESSNTFHVYTVFGNEFSISYFQP